MNRQEGITLVELIIVISVIGILIVALGFEFQGWMGKYRVESQIKEMHVDMMNARASAMSRNKMRCATLLATSYMIREDADPPPDGDGDCNDAGDTLIVQKNLNPAYPIIATPAIPKTIRFTTQGVVEPADVGIVRISVSTDADYDCIDIGQLRIIMGKWNGTCQAK
jgi:prepilin-type N-terminal cleavage/methylation domain-containing protein